MKSNLKRIPLFLSNAPLWAKTCLVLILIGGSAALASDTPLSVREKEVSESRYWQLLLHAHPRFFGGFKGESDDPSFYLDPEGRRDPLKELQTDIQFFSKSIQVGPRKQHPQCAFPERYRFLKQELHLTIEDVPCEEFKKWKEALDAHSITFVFADAYLNNPTSMFGHTFLRIDSGKTLRAAPGSKLWGYGINYGIESGGSSMFSVVVFGVLGGFNGYFSMLPYFEKINEYNDSEDRDLWEYHLNLSPVQIDHLMNHLWELLSSNFPYYFFDKNCTTQILALLEVANPDWHLVDSFFYPIIPVDGVRAITQIPNSILDVDFRPSLYRKLHAKVQKLNTQELQSFDHAISNHLEITQQESPLVLDALVDYQDYRMMKRKEHLTDLEKTKRRTILVTRAKSKEPPVEVSVERPSAQPEQGNDTTKLTLYSGLRDTNGFLGLKFRPALHDLLDWDEGYVRYSNISFGKVDLRWSLQDSSLRLHQLDVIEVTSLNPLHYLNKDLSWTAGIQVLSPEDVLCQSCLAGNFFGGAGYSSYLGKENESPLIFSLLKANLQYSGWFEHAYRVGPALVAGILDTYACRIKAGLETEYAFYPNQQGPNRYFIRVGGKASWTPQWGKKNVELRIGTQVYLKEQRNFMENTGEFSVFF